jgi:hypothetical protein
MKPAPDHLRSIIFSLHLHTNLQNIIGLTVRSFPGMEFFVEFFPLKWDGQMTGPDAKVIETGCRIFTVLVISAISDPSCWTPFKPVIYRKAKLY